MRFGLRSKLIAVCGALALASIPAYAAVDTFMTIDGGSQGSFKAGSVRGATGSETIQLVSVEHQATASRDAATGLASGRRQHSPVVIMKKIDKTSPLFFQAMQRNEVLRGVTISFAGSGAGAGKVAQRIAMGGVAISGIQNVNGMERITLTYQTIEVTWTDGGKTATDDWEAR